VGADYPSYGEGSEPAISKLRLRALRADVRGPEPYEVPLGNTGSGSPANVCALLIAMLTSKKLGELHGDRRICRCIVRMLLIGAKIRRTIQVVVKSGVKSIVGEKRTETCSLGRIAVAVELVHLQERRPVLLLVCHIGSEILLHDPIDSLSLAVRLRMEGRAELRGNP
jgi:hypothetical protein